MSSIENTFEKFQKNFESVTLTLIADLNKINESLSRVTESVDLIEKLRIQMSENKQNLGQLEKQVKSLIQRLDKMSAGGFQIPEAPLTPSPKAASAQMDNLLNMQFTPKTTSEPDDLEKEFGPLPDAKPAAKPSPTAPPAPVEEPKPAEVQVKDEVFEDEIVNIPDIPLPPPTKVEPKPVAKPTPPATLPPTGSGLGPLSPLPRMPGAFVPSATHEVPVVPTQKKVDNPATATDIFNNLIADMQNAKTQGEAGDLVLKAKDILSKKIQFNTSYFEMLMYGGPLKAKKDAPLTPDLVKQGMDKIRFWMAKF